MDKEMNELITKIDNHYILSRDDIYNFAMSYVQKRNIANFLSDVSFQSCGNHIATYNTRTHEMVFNDDRIMLTSYYYYEGLQELYRLDKESSSYYINYYYLNKLFHELTHVLQEAKYAEGKNNTFCELYKLCSKLHHDSVDFYNENHDLFPMEIEADNKGRLLAHDFLCKTKMPRRDINIIYLQYLNGLLNNYRQTANNIIAPIDKLLEEKEEMHKIKKLLKNKKLSREVRLFYGLSITPDEYCRLSDERQKVLIR